MWDIIQEYDNQESEKQFMHYLSYYCGRKNIIKKPKSPSEHRVDNCFTDDYTGFVICDEYK